MSFSEQDSSCVDDEDDDGEYGGGVGGFGSGQLSDSSPEDALRLDEAGLRRSRCQRQASLQVCA